MMLKFADLIHQNMEELAALDSLDAGKLAEKLRYYAGAADKIHGSTLLHASGAHRGGGAYHPYEGGPRVGRRADPSLPRPFGQAGWTFFLAGIPDGVLNVVTGYGHSAGAAITSHMDIDKVSFTGSMEVGRLVMQAAAASNLKPVTLELGGKSPFIIFDDVDVDKVAALALRAITYNKANPILIFVNHFIIPILFNQGEICVAGSRVFVQEGIYDAFVVKLLEKVESLVVGDPFDPSVHQATQVDEKQYNKILSYIEIGKKEGATLSTGGKPAANKGYYIEPTIFTDVTDDVTYEIQVSNSVVWSVEEAIKRGNATKYGLAAGVMTNDLNIVNTVSRSIRAGIVWINCYFAFSDTLPYGGYKMSGFGRDMGMESLECCLQTKSVAMPIHNSPWL
ncbi:hypothetical protein SASPL_117686 [Salvia splendens]|uniref:Aldehyde dehydrogenase domain-containing protein n=1 Tax=Salvia splendens TaxID=180675 RepID=A0A8X8ZXT6_SALSN|nr:hypothetical protein SASPL_117686 [Salvia splendens]